MHTRVFLHDIHEALHHPRVKSTPELRQLDRETMRRVDTRIRTIRIHVDRIRILLLFRIRHDIGGMTGPLDIQAWLDPWRAMDLPP